MRAGSLTQIVDVYRMIDKQSSTGAMTKEKSCIARLRCELVRQNGSYVQTVYEETDRVNVVFQTWLNESIIDSDSIFWCGQEFKITLIEYSFPSNTMKLHCSKIIK